MFSIIWSPLGVYLGSEDSILNTLIMVERYPVVKWKKEIPRVVTICRVNKGKDKNYLESPSESLMCQSYDCVRS